MTDDKDICLFIGGSLWGSILTYILLWDRLA